MPSYIDRFQEVLLALTGQCKSDHPLLIHLLTLWCGDSRYEEKVLEWIDSHSLIAWADSYKLLCVAHEIANNPEVE